MTVAKERYGHIIDRSKAVVLLFSLYQFYYQTFHSLMEKFAFTLSTTEKVWLTSTGRAPKLIDATSFKRNAPW